MRIKSIIRNRHKEITNYKSDKNSRIRNNNISGSRDNNIFRSRSSENNINISSSRSRNNNNNIIRSRHINITRIRSSSKVLFPNGRMVGGLAGINRVIRRWSRSLLEVCPWSLQCRSSCCCGCSFSCSCSCPWSCSCSCFCYS